MKIRLDYEQFDGLQKAMEEYQGNTEKAINEVLHNEAGPLIADAVRNLMPQSGKTWKGKKGAAKTSNSLMNVDTNLAVTVKTRGDYGYLYFPDDGTNTRRHVGNQQFFVRGGESVADDIVDRIVNKLINNFEKGD